MTPKLAFGTSPRAACSGLEGETPDAPRAKLPGAIRDLVPDPGPTPFDLITPGLVPA
jgi:hypothetical protein